MSTQRSGPERRQIEHNGACPRCGLSLFLNCVRFKPRRTIRRTWREPANGRNGHSHEARTREEIVTSSFCEDSLNNFPSARFRMGPLRFQPRGEQISITFAREIHRQPFVLGLDESTTLARRNVARPCVVKDRRTFAQKRSTIELTSCPAIARKRAQRDEGRGRGTGQRSRSEQRQLPGLAGQGHASASRPSKLLAFARFWDIDALTDPPYTQIRQHTRCVTRHEPSPGEAAEVVRSCGRD